LNHHAVGTSSAPLRVTWTQRDTILYALGVGAGVETDDLAFTTENSIGVTLRALPTFGLVLGDYGAEAMRAIGDVDPATIVHGGQSIELHRPLAAAGALVITTRIAAIYDKGSAAIVILEANAIDDATGQPLFTSTSNAFVRGAGGWGGERGPSSGSKKDRLDRPPDATVSYPTMATQALLYRLSGDRNPLHSDPVFATRAGFERPILHGLCSLGIAVRGVLRAVCDDDVDRCRYVSCRFSAPVYPGDVLITDIWVVEDGARFETRRDSGEVVLSAGACRLELASVATDARAAKEPAT
jgi:acyl dehydratase